MIRYCFSTVGAYEGRLGLSRNIFIIFRRKPVVGDLFGEGRGIGGRSFEKSAPLLVKSPAKMLFLSAIQTNLQGTSFLMRRYVMREYRHPRSIRGRSPTRSRTGFDRISVYLKLKIVGCPFLGTPLDQRTAGIMLFGGTPFGRLTAGIMSPWNVNFWRRPCPCQP